MGCSDRSTDVGRGPEADQYRGRSAAVPSVPDTDGAADRASGGGCGAVEALAAGALGVRLGRRSLAGLMLVLACSCATVKQAVPVAAPPPSAPGGARSSAPTSLQLGSEAATLGALRAEQGHRPVLVAVAGLCQPAPVQPRTTDPVNGGLDLPTNAATVAWWAGGSGPGEPTGTVVLAAHVVCDGHAGPFTRLDRWTPGALVVPTTADGIRYRYAATGSRRAPKASLNRAALFSPSGAPMLALVTCGGRCDPVTRSFADNLVVTAVSV